MAKHQSMIYKILNYYFTTCTQSYHNMYTELSQHVHRVITTHTQSYQFLFLDLFVDVLLRCYEILCLWLSDLVIC